MSSRLADQQGGMQYCRHFLADNSAFHVERCMSVMQSGTQMVKLKNGSKGLVRLFYLDEHRSCIRWRPSRKSEKAKITIDSLYKVSEGRQSDIFHRHADANFDPGCCFTIYHGNHMESLDLVTTKPEEARTWVTGLRYLMAGISDEDSLAKRQRTHDQWMKQTFEEADKNGDGLLNIEEIYQLLHKMNVNLPRRKVKQMFQEADTDDQQGTLTYEEFSVFYRMMSMRRDLFLLLMSFSERKDHLTAEELGNFLRTEQKMANVTTEYCLDVIDKFEVSDENKQNCVMGIEGFTNFMRSPACDVFNPLHHEINQDMDQPLCNYYIASSHNTYLTGDQLLSHSKTDMYAWVLQSGCRCVEVDCWDGPDGEPMVQHGYTLTSKITLKSVIEAINKYAFINNEYPVILSIENHCSIQQQKKIAQYLREIFGDKLDVGESLSKDHKMLPSPNSLRGKILIKGKRLPPYLSADVEEGEVSDDDSADEIEDDFKLKNSSSNGPNQHQVESYIRKKLDSLVKESQIGDKEDTDSFSIRALLRATHEGLNMNLKQNSNVREGLKKSQSRSFISNLKYKRHSKSRFKSQSLDTEEDGLQEASGKDTGQFIRGCRRRKTIKLSRDLSDLVVFSNSVVSQECLEESTPGNVLSFSENRAQHLVHHRAERLISFNQRQLSRIYPSAYRIDSSNFNPQVYWNVGCQLVALNYQTEGRMMQLNRAKFLANGNSGYVLKPQPMCKGSFNPFCDDPFPAYPKKQLLLKIISGQQLPKPPDSMLGDRGEIIDPFVEVEIIGLPVDCCKEQTRVVDDNGFNPVWEETLSFTLHMAELALVRFLVWDHDPIGRDFVGQRTVAFSSLMPGYRHVYLEGLTEASIFVHIAVHDIYGKWSPLVLNPSYTIMHFLGANKGRQLRGIKGLFNRNSKRSVDTHTGLPLRKRSVSDHLLRRTASAPAKGRKKSKMGGFSEASSDRNSGGDPQDSQASHGAVERRAPPRPQLQHRPASMPLEKLLQGALALSSPNQDQPDPGTDTHTEMVALERPKSASVDLLIETSACLQPQDLSLPADSSQEWTMKPAEVQETTYLVIGEGSNDGHSDDSPKDLHDQSDEAAELASPNKTILYQTSFPDTAGDHIRSQSSNVQARNDDIPVSSRLDMRALTSSMAAPSSALHMDQSDVPSEISLQDSTISRLIDAVSLGNGSDTCGSISALIGQFDVTSDQSNLTLVSNMNGTQPHKLTPCRTPPFDPSDTALFSSPETTDPSVYTILDEEVLSPVTVYNLREQSIQKMRVESEESTPVGSLAPSPVKHPHLQCSDNEDNWGHPYHCAGMQEEDHRMHSCHNEDMVGEGHRLLSYHTENTRDHGSNVPSYHTAVTELPSYRTVGMKGKGSGLHSYHSNALEDSGSPVHSYHNNAMESKGSRVPWYHSAVVSEGEGSSIPSYGSPRFAREGYQGRGNVSINSTASDCFLLCHDSAGSSLMEVEINVDEDPLDITLTPRNGSAWVGAGETPSTLRRLPKSSTRCQYSCPVTSPRTEHHLANNGVNVQGEYSKSSHGGYYESGDRWASAERNERNYNGYASDCFWVPRSVSPIQQCLDRHLVSCSPPLQNNSRGLPVPAQQGHTDTNLNPPPISKVPSPCKSKSLGDLTSEDISCNFESKYKFICRSFVTPGMRDRKWMGSLTNRPLSADPLTEQLRKLVSLEQEDRPLPPLLPLPACPLGGDEDSPQVLSRRLSSRSQSRVRHIASRARERQQEACKPHLSGAPCSTAGVVLRNKPAAQNPTANRHSTGSYIAGYLDQVEGRGLPEGACTTLHYSYRDHSYNDDSVLQADSCPPSEPEVYFLLRL
ncbi:1-phosphatidylinositol 4,5-bisphosphate phosphodiesterase eta-1 isoform X3 [Anguilla rostrata]|uniref:1-phosphatidylinositol 4,5-bisphosphate phosphodiesterase eta-1 isoform X3 n=1 Tax=Anguilla rostrata TaxID=7938 RepID=UPI0030D0CC95